MINKNKLVYDPADSDNSDFVGSYIIGADGVEITHTQVGAKEGLDVNVINASIEVTATDLDIRDLSAAQDNVAISDGSDVLSITASGQAEVAVTEALPAGTNNIGDVDVASLPGGLTGYAEDSAHVSGDIGLLNLAVRNDAGGTLVSADGDYSPLQVDADGNLRVITAVDFSYDFAEDSAHSSGDVGAYVLSVRQDTLSASASASGDYQSFKTDALGRLYINEAHQTMTNDAVSVTTSATDLVGTDLVNRKRILIQNLGTKKVYIGKDNTVTTSNGVELFSGASMELDIGPGVNVHAISASGTQDVRVMELA